MIVHNNFNQKTSIPYDVQRSFDGLRCILSRYLDHRTQSEFCILINYPEICNAYGSLVHRQATHTHKKKKSIFMSLCMSVLRQHVYFKLSFIYFLHHCISYTIIFVFDLFLYRFMPLFTFSLCLYLPGKLYKMCRLKSMYNRWSSRQQVTDGGSLSYGFQNVILLIH